MLTSTLDRIVMLLDVRCGLFKTKSKRKMKVEKLMLVKVSKVDASVRYADEDAGVKLI